MGNLFTNAPQARSAVWRDSSTRVSRNLQYATHTKEYHPNFPPQSNAYDVFDTVSLTLLHAIMREKALSGLWLVVSEKGEFTIKLENFYLSVEFVPVSDISYAVSHRWGKEKTKVNGVDFAVDWIGLIPNGRAWIDCVTHMNDPLLVKRTLEKMGEVYVCCKVHAIYCIGGNEDVVECVFRGWMFQELSYVTIKEAIRKWNDRGLGAWSLKMIGCLDQYDMHDLLVMTKSTSSPNVLASAVGASLRSFHLGGSLETTEFRSWINSLPDDATSVNLVDFKRHLVLTSSEPLASIGVGARLTEYMAIKLVSLYKPFLGDGEVAPVSNDRYIDTLLNNLNMALYSQERDALVATISSYDVYLRKQDDYKLSVKCAQFLEEEEYFIIEPKRHDTTRLLLEALSLLIKAGKFKHDQGISEVKEDGVISWLSTKDQITIYYTGNRLSSWKRSEGGLDWSTIPGVKAATHPMIEITMSEDPDVGYTYADPTA